MHMCVCVSRPLRTVERYAKIVRVKKAPDESDHELKS